MQFVGRFKGELPGLIEEQSEDPDIVEDEWASFRILEIVKLNFEWKHLRILDMIEKSPKPSVPLVRYRINA